MYADVCVKPLDLKTAILSALAKKPRMGARELYQSLTKEYSYRISYQGVHKALGQLTGRDVVNRSGSKYVLSNDWLSEAQSFLTDLEGATLHQRPLSVLDIPAFCSHSVQGEGSLIEPYLWMLTQVGKIKRAGPLKAAVFQRRAWPLPLLKKEGVNGFRKIFNERNQTAVVQGHKAADRYFGALWEKCGFSVGLGKGACDESEWLVAGDFVFQIRHPERTRNVWDRFYDGLTQGGVEALWLAHQAAFETKSASEMVVTRNADFAENLRARARFALETK